MRAVDTNALVRLLARDDARQVAAAEAFIASGAWVSTVVLAESLWVLASVYELQPAQIARAVEMLLNHAQLSLQDSEAVADALDEFRRKPKLGFSDCLVLALARKARHVPLGTFDKGLAKLDDAQLLR
jgi:predicted nucleic-acid-binding protein